MFSKPVLKPPEPTLPRCPSRAVRGESPDSERVKSRRNRRGFQSHDSSSYVTILSMGELTSLVPRLSPLGKLGGAWERGYELTAPPTFRENAIRPTVVLEESI